MSNLPPPPIKDKMDSYTWQDWFRQLHNRANQSLTTVPWSGIDFTGSNITNIVNRSHNQLQTLQGGTTGEYYHLTAADYAAIGNITEAAQDAVGNILTDTFTINFTYNDSTPSITADVIPGNIGHDVLGGIQGGASSDYYHITQAQHTDLTDAGDSSLHYHSADRNRSNHSGTQTASTISDLESTVKTYTATEKVEYNAPSTGFSITIANSTNVLVLKPSGTLATGTVVMPASPTDGQVVRIASTQVITTLTHNANTGQTLNGGLGTISAHGFGSWVYRSTDTSWYRIS